MHIYTSIMMQNVPFSDFNQNRSVVLQLSNAHFHGNLFSGYRVSHGRAEQINMYSGEERKRPKWAIIRCREL